MNDRKCVLDVARYLFILALTLYLNLLLRLIRVNVSYEIEMGSSPAYSGCYIIEFTKCWYPLIVLIH